MNPSVCGPSKFNPFALLTTLVSKRSLRKPHFPDGFALKRPIWKERTVSWTCAVFGEKIEEKGMEGFDEKCGIFSDSVEDEYRESSSSSETLSSEEKQSFDGSEKKSERDEKTQVEDVKMYESNSNISVTEMIMKQRFSKLLLGEDMSGCGNGVCTALAISNAITNLCTAIFGQLWRLEPLSSEKKSMWQREMEWLLCVSDHIVEMIPSWQSLPDGKRLEVMTCRPRSDLFINLPALCKLDNMLLEILDSFHDQEFWYVNDQGILEQDSDGLAKFRKPIHRQEDKWWLPVPRVPTNGLRENSRKQMQHKRECANQILKAVMAINGNTLAEMEVPESYLNSLPKNGRESLGDVMHQYITSDQFSPDCLLDCLKFSSEHQALEVANRLESSIYMWRQRATKSAKSKMADDDERELFSDRAQSLLICLKQKFPGLTQTTLDVSKIQFNTDVGKSILESYSRVLESVAFNIVARIDDLLYVDDLTKKSLPPVTAICHKRVTTSHLVPISSTSYAATFRKLNGCGFSVKKVLTEFLSGEQKRRNSRNI